MEKIIQKAIEGGYDDCILVASIKEKFKEYCLDPSFWQALARAENWGEGHERSCQKIDGNFMKTSVKCTCGSAERWKEEALEFFEINLTEGWIAAVAYLAEITK